MTAIPYREPSECYPVLLPEVQDQPGECSLDCPCSVGPSDGSAYGWRWLGSGAAPWSWLGPVPTDQAVTR